MFSSAAEEATAPPPAAAEPEACESAAAAAPEPVDEDKDLEDGEIEDDGDEEVPPAAAAAPEPEKPKVVEPETAPVPAKENRERGERRHERRRHDDTKKTKHMTEAEKSILHLRKRERMQREKWERYRKEQNLDAPVDDFAINIEKAIANVLKKDKHGSEEESDEKRGRKRKRFDKHKNNKQRRLESPKSEETTEDVDMNRSPPKEEKKDRSASPTKTDESYDSESSDRSRASERRREYNKKGKGRNRDRNRKRSRERRAVEQQQQFKVQESQGVCVFFLQGKCQKNDCPYSHEAMPPMKLELCKFYLKDCCAKGEKCSYMHSEFPCKFYHTGLVCLQGDNCKFAHGGPLDEHRRQILFKHIETAPREILGGFPRMSREETLNKINLTQQNLCQQYAGGGVDKPANIFDVSVPPPIETMAAAPPPKEKPRRTRWQDPEPTESVPPFGGFVPYPASQDQDMRVNSNGDIDMRTLPPLDSGNAPDAEPNFTQDIDIRNPNMLQFDTKDTDIRQIIKDVDIRQLPPDDRVESSSSGPPADMPKAQRELYLRIQAQQKTNLPEQEPERVEVDDNINWYSDDDDEDENRLTIKVEEEEKKEEETIMSPTQIKPQEVVEKLGDLSKIDISAEVTKLLTSMSQQQQQQQQKEAPKVARVDPRQQREPMKVSIYDQGSVGDEPKSPDVLDSDFRARPDVDLRNLNLPFKGMLNYTPAKEIDASVNSHPPMMWKVEIVDIPRPDYTGLKLNVQDAEKTGDPRLRKIFRLNAAPEDSPASPKASPKARTDPRLKKAEPSSDPASLTYSQQLNILQSSAFFQSLTSNQKLLLNQELASRNEGGGINDPVLSSMLSSLNLIPSNNMPSPNMGAALNILANVNKLNQPMRGPMPGLLGAAPGIPNIPAEFTMPPPPPQQAFNYHQDGGGFVGYDDGYYAPPDGGGGFRDNRGFNRDRRRGRSNFNRNNGRNFRNRNNRNRSHTPP